MVGTTGGEGERDSDETDGSVGGKSASGDRVPLLPFGLSISGTGLECMHDLNKRIYAPEGLIKTVSPVVLGVSIPSEREPLFALAV